MELEDNRLQFAYTRKYGQVAVTNQSQEYKVYDDDDNLLYTYPAGMVLRWMQKNGEPGIMTVPGVFTKDFTSIVDIRDYIDNNSILG